MKKKLLSLAVALAMALSLLPMAVAAEGNETETVPFNHGSGDIWAATMHAGTGDDHSGDADLADTYTASASPSSGDVDYVVNVNALGVKNHIDGTSFDANNAHRWMGFSLQLPEGMTEESDLFISAADSASAVEKSSYKTTVYDDGNGGAFASFYTYPGSSENNSSGSFTVYVGFWCDVEVSGDEEPETVSYETKYEVNFTWSAYEPKLLSLKSGAVDLLPGTLTDAQLTAAESPDGAIDLGTVFLPTGENNLDLSGTFFRNGIEVKSVVFSELKYQSLLKDEYPAEAIGEAFTAAHPRAATSGTLTIKDSLPENRCVVLIEADNSEVESYQGATADTVYYKLTAMKTFDSSEEDEGGDTPGTDTPGAGEEIVIGDNSTVVDNGGGSISVENGSVSANISDEQQKESAETAIKNTSADTTELNSAAEKALEDAGVSASHYTKDEAVTALENAFGTEFSADEVELRTISTLEMELTDFDEDDAVTYEVDAFAFVAAVPGNGKDYNHMVAMGDAVPVTSFPNGIDVTLGVPSTLASNGNIVYVKHADDDAVRRTVVTGTVSVIVYHFSPFTISLSNPDGGGSHGSASSSKSGGGAATAPGTVVVAPVDSGTASGIFSDVPAGHTFATEIGWARDNNIMGGYADGSYRPDAYTTRQVLWMVLGRLAGANPADMAAAQAWSINSGISDGTNPTGTLSRQQLITMLYRVETASGTPSGSADLSAFGDSALVADYAKEAMAWGVANGIITGNNGNLNPEGPATRAHFAAFLYRYANLPATPASAVDET